jgi:hypothetical protein
MFDYVLIKFLIPDTRIYRRTFTTLNIFGEVATIFSKKTWRFWKNDTKLMERLKFFEKIIFMIMMQEYLVSCSTPFICAKFIILSLQL